MGRYEGGWIKLYRKLASSDIGKNGYCLAIMTTLFMWANRSESTVRWNGAPRRLDPGALVIGIRQLAEHLQFSKSTVYRQLKYLSERDTIRIEAGTEGSLVTIVNYTEYQSPDEIVGHPVGRGGNAGGTRTGHGRDTSDTPNGEVRIEKEEYIGLDFEELYNQYPRRKGTQRKSKALETCRKKFNTPDSYAELLNAIKRYHVECIRDQKVNTPYVLQFATFVNGVWEEYRAPSARPAGQTVDRGLKTFDDLGGSNAAAS